MASTVTDKVNLSGLRVLIVEDDALAALDAAESGGAFVQALGRSCSSRGGCLLAPYPAAYGIARPQLRDGFVTPSATALEQLQVPYALVSGYRGQELENWGPRAGL